MTLTIQLPDDLAARISALPEAERQTFAVAALREAAERQATVAPRNLAEFLGGFIGGVTGGQDEAEPVYTGDASRDAFVAYLEEKRLAGRL